MYLIISEDGDINKTDEITEEQRDAAADGVIDILLFGDLEDPMRFGSNGWEVIEDA